MIYMTNTNPRTAAIGDVVTFLPLGAKRRVTVKIVGTYDGLGVYGYRVYANGITANQAHAYFI